MAAPLLVTNLPPCITHKQVQDAFSIYGPVHSVFLCSDYYLNKFYPLDSAYIYYEEKRSTDFFLEDFVDVVIDGYFTDIQNASSSPLVNSTAIVYGLTQGITKSDLFYALRLDRHAEVAIQKPGSSNNDGYAFIKFSDIKYCQSFLMCNTEAHVGRNTFGIKPYPQVQTAPKCHHAVTLSCVPSTFARLRKMKRFQDFTIQTKEKSYQLSSKVLSASSKVIFKITHTYPLQYQLELKEYDGDYDEFFDALYGIPIVISPENAEFIHAVASKLEIDDLIVSAGAVNYEKLTLYNFKKILNGLISKKLNYDYVIEFIGSHFAEVIQNNNNHLLLDLPPDALKKIAHHSYVQQLSSADVSVLFKDVLCVKKINQSDISHIDNQELDINSNRQLLIEYLDCNKSSGMSLRENVSDTNQQNKDTNNDQRDNNSLFNNFSFIVPETYSAYSDSDSESGEYN